jgi:hypothetical protein
VIEPIEHVLQDAGREATLFRQLDDPRAPYRDQGKLRGHEKPVQYDEQQRHAEPPRDAHQVDRVRCGHARLLHH